MKPGLAHFLLGAAGFWLALLAAMGVNALLPVPWGQAAAVAFLAWLVPVSFYIGRERRQAEERSGTNRLSPLSWLPRSLRDIAWPAAGALLSAAIVLLGLAGLS